MQLDHLVVAATTLEEGVAWCERTFGVTPGPGGKHAFMGTHNRLLSVASARFPRAYLELIAIDPDAAAPARPRWFDLDDPRLRRAIDGGPRLIHWVARCDDIQAEAKSLCAAGIDPGDVMQAERATPLGMLRWQITIRADGRRLFGGAMPTLIQWGRDGAIEARATNPASGSGMQAGGDVHPADTLVPSGVALEHLALRGVPASVAARLTAAGARAPSAHEGSNAAPLGATLSTPRGPVLLEAFISEGEPHAQP
jgi:hypothetical protein